MSVGRLVGELAGWLVSMFDFANKGYLFFTITIYIYERGVIIMLTSCFLLSENGARVASERESKRSDLV